MATRTVVCPECAEPVPYGRLSCPECGSLLASVAGLPRRVANPAVASLDQPAVASLDQPAVASYDQPAVRPPFAWQEPIAPLPHSPAPRPTLRPVPTFPIPSPQAAPPNGAPAAPPEADALRATAPGAPPAAPVLRPSPGPAAAPRMAAPAASAPAAIPATPTTPRTPPATRPAAARPPAAVAPSAAVAPPATPPAAAPPRQTPARPPSPTNGSPVPSLQAASQPAAPAGNGPAAPPATPPAPANITPPAGATPAPSTQRPAHAPRRPAPASRPPSSRTAGTTAAAALGGTPSVDPTPPPRPAPRRRTTRIVEGDTGETPAEWPIGAGQGPRPADPPRAVVAPTFRLKAPLGTPPAGARSAAPTETTLPPSASPSATPEWPASSSAIPLPVRRPPDRARTGTRVGAARTPADAAPAAARAPAIEGIPVPSWPPEPAGEPLPPSAVFAGPPDVDVEPSPAGRRNAAAGRRNTAAGSRNPADGRRDAAAVRPPSAPAPAGSPRATVAALLAGLRFDTPGNLPDWLVAAGSAIAAVGFVLPWSDVVLGSKGFGGYTDSWGLASPSHVLVLLLLSVTLTLAVMPNRVPPWIRTAIAGILLCGLLLGLTWPYLIGGFGASLGVMGEAVAAILLAAGGILELRAARHAGADESV